MSDDKIIKELAINLINEYREENTLKLIKKLAVIF
jgi:hypothetical protein